MHGTQGTACRRNGNLSKSYTVICLQLFLDLSNYFRYLLYVLNLTVNHCSFGVRNAYVILKEEFFVNVFADNAHYGSCTDIKGEDIVILRNHTFLLFFSFHRKVPFILRIYQRSVF